MKTEYKIVKFASKLVELVLSGEKTATWRLFDDKDLKVGDNLILTNKETGENFAKAIIVAVSEKELGNIVDADFDGHERFESREAMIQAYKGYYGEKVSEKSTVKIIKFRLI